MFTSKAEGPASVTVMLNYIKKDMAVLILTSVVLSNVVISAYSRVILYRRLSKDFEFLFHVILYLSDWFPRYILPNANARWWGR